MEGKGRVNHMICTLNEWDIEDTGYGFIIWIYENDDNENDEREIFSVLLIFHIQQKSIDIMFLVLLKQYSEIK